MTTRELRLREILTQLVKLEGSRDVEKAHVDADKYLTNAIFELTDGTRYEDVGESIINTYGRIRKYYA